MDRRGAGFGRSGLLCDCGGLVGAGVGEPRSKLNKPRELVGRSRGVSEGERLGRGGGGPLSLLGSTDSFITMASCELR